jgi:hypothetical protein
VLIGSQQEPGHHGACSFETWTFDGSDWTKQKPATQLPVPGRGLVADPGSGHVLAVLNPRVALVPAGLFAPDCPAGSPEAAAIPASTWVWTGKTWDETTGQQPPVATEGDAGMAVVGGHATLVTEAGEVWSWTGTDWTQQPGANPPTPPRTHAAVMPDRRGNLVLFGGGVQTQPFGLGDTWIWKAGAWTEAA